MAEITVKINKAAYGSEAMYTCMRFALAALSEGHQVNIFLLEDAVSAAKAGQETPEFPGLIEGRMPNMEELIKSVLRQGAVIKCCAVCCHQRALVQEELIPGCEIGSMKDLLHWVVSSDKLVEF